MKFAPYLNEIQFGAKLFHFFIEAGDNSMQLPITYWNSHSSRSKLWYPLKCHEIPYSDEMFERWRSTDF